METFTDAPERRPFDSSESPPFSGCFADARPVYASTNRHTDTLLAQIAQAVPSMQARGAALDDHGLYPSEDVAFLGRIGALQAPFPSAFGGLGMGTSAPSAPALATMLQQLGRGNLAVGRLFEAHVNAVRLLALYGSHETLHRAARDAGAGGLFGLWVTDPAAGGLQARADGVLQGAKAFCSGAGHCSHAVVTVMDSSGDTRLAYVSTHGATAVPLGARLQGMRAAATGKMVFDGVTLGDADWVGRPGDYLREPHFSAGAWRTSAVTCGGLAALVQAAMAELAARGRDGDPHQQARMGQAWIAQETALMWLDRAASAAEGCQPHATSADIVATVNLARLAIEAACLDAMQLVTRSLGLSALMQPSLIERLGRDLATYLRQPAGDDVLTSAAAHIMQTRERRS